MGNLSLINLHAFVECQHIYMVSAPPSAKTLRSQDPRGYFTGIVHHDVNVGGLAVSSSQKRVGRTPRSLTRLLALMMELLGAWYSGGL